MNHDLYTLTTHVDPSSVRAKTLLVTLGSFMDAGHVQRLVDEHLLGSLPHHVMARFDVDQLLDYRGRRPRIVFDRDHFTDYQSPELSLHHLLDAEGVPFLLLSGPEPGLQWEALARAVIDLVTQFGVSTVVTLQSVPLEVPHTRPVTLTRSASKPDLIPGNRPLFGRMQMGASFPAMLSVRMEEAGLDVIGMAAHVPHYLGDHEFPDGALALLRAVERHTDLDLPGNQLALRATLLRAQVDEQIARSEELGAMVETLERRFDEFTREVGMLPASVEEDLPSPDELGAQAEEFLKGLGD